MRGERGREVRHGSVAIRPRATRVASGATARHTHCRAARPPGPCIGCASRDCGGFLMSVATRVVVLGVVVGFVIRVEPLLAQETVRVNVDSAGHQSRGGAYYPSISGDGRFVAFTSGSDDLVAGDTNRTSDVFVHD